MANGYVIFKEGRTNIPSPVETISYFKGAGNYIFVYYTKGTQRKQCGNLKEWEEKPDVVESGFLIRVHDSYIINWKNVSSYDRDYAVMDDSAKTPVPLNEEGFKKLEQKFSEKKSHFIPAPALIPLFLSRRRDFRNDEEE